MDRQQQRKDYLQRVHQQRPLAPSSAGEPYYDFINLEPTERLEFEMLDYHNYKAIYEMFKGDETPFAVPEYKNLDALKKYVDNHLNYNRFSPKRGACDWLYKIKKTGEYIGLLNLYELNSETIADMHQHCVIGFATKPSARRKRFTIEAIGQLVDHAITHFQRRHIIAYTLRNNIASKKCLAKANFEEMDDNDHVNDKYCYFQYVV